MSKQTTIGIGEKISTASSAEQIVELLTQASEFQEAAPCTIRRWKRNAERRLDQLGQDSVKVSSILHGIFVKAKLE